MSVLIEGLEMPTGCSALTLKVWPDGQVEIFDADGEWKTSKAIPVPPHGRLIDADALDDAFTGLRWDSEGLAHWGGRNEWCLSGNEVEELFNNAPTVIPADKEGT